MTTDPSLSFQTALRAALIADPAVTALLPAAHVRAGSTRPDKLPTIILANPQTIHLGRASGGFYVTSVAVDLHIWALDDGADMARQIGVAAALALWDAPHAEGIAVDDYMRPGFSYMRDPDPELAYCHGIGTAEAVVRWRV
ncbi:tail completion protein gp17 [Salipiger sp.]|uniref:tail completion protein gp17 n=1 Tax=Salipiger sp. TaxID=2078585 RepID=UPI003A9770BE